VLNALKQATSQSPHPAQSTDAGVPHNQHGETSYGRSPDGEDTGGQCKDWRTAMSSAVNIALIPTDTFARISRVLHTSSQR
jgi:hypothetical protein